MGVCAPHLPPGCPDSPAAPRDTVLIDGTSPEHTQLLAPGPHGGRGCECQPKSRLARCVNPAAGATPSQRPRVQNPEGLCSPPHSLCCGLGGLPTESGCLACSGSPLETPEQGGSQTPPPSGYPRPPNYGKGWARPSWSWKLGEQAGGAGFHWGDRFILGDGAPPPPFARSAPFMCRRGNWTGSPSEAPEVTSGLRRKRKGKPPLAGGRGQGLPV